MPSEIRNRMGRMGLAEAQGYLRARLSWLVARETQSTMARYNLQDAVFTPLSRYSMDDLVSLAVQRLLSETAAEVARRQAA
jgi:hypothetical protein